MQLSLLIDSAPDGFRYLPDFLTPAEETTLLAQLATIELHTVVMHGQAAKRTVAHFGLQYGYDSRSVEPGTALPDWLQALATRVALPMRARPETIAEVLVTSYPIGSRIGWHRDAPMFGPTIAGLSLGAACTLRFRRERPHPHPPKDSWEQHAVDVAPRSLYILDGAARQLWQHMIPAVPAPRWSLTFRTVSPTAKPSRALLRRRGDG